MPFCDIVMKGGVTSGVVYPLAIDELSKRFTFKNVGGTSAGAIAACLTAAAEYRRATGGGRAGFDDLAKLPEELGREVTPGKRLLLSLFEPHDETRDAFAVLSAFLGDQSKLRKLLRAGGQALLRYPHLLLLSMLPFVAICATGDGEVLAWLGGVLAFAFGAVMFVLAMLARLALHTLPRNRFGLCTGETLIQWLHEKINSAAGKAPGEPPLTFGELKAKDVCLQMVTTNLTHGRPYELPQDDNIHLFFDEADMRRIFPRDIVEHLIAKSPSRRDGKYELPKGDDLPIVFAARLSLSFPLLFELVPLCAVDYTWGRGQQRLELCWFIDGGLTSNFPIHFFDSALPSWPTFGLDLREAHPAYPPSDANECENVWMVKDNSAGTSENWNLFAQSTAYVGIGGYLGAIINTMQNWRDNAQQRLPGYRDRIAHLKMRPSEGGLNLNMGKELIAKLAARGRCAGEELARRFAPGSTHLLNWNNHRWVRYLVGMSRLEAILGQMGTAFRSSDNGGPTYAELVARTKNEPRTGYFEKLSSRQEARRRKIERLLAVDAELPPAVTGLQGPEDIPKPMPIVQMTPRF